MNFKIKQLGQLSHLKEYYKYVICAISIMLISKLSFALPAVLHNEAISKNNTESTVTSKKLLNNNSNNNSSSNLSSSVNTINNHTNNTIKNNNISANAKVTSNNVTSNKVANNTVTNNQQQGKAESSIATSKVILNFENADIQSVIKAISQLSGKNFVIDPRVKGTVNIVSDQPVSKADSYKVLEAALRMQGFATVASDGVIKVIPEAEAKTYGMQVSDNLNDSSKMTNHEGDQIITKIFVIQHGSAQQFSNALRPIIANNNAVAVYQDSNAIIITDYASNISRISKIIEQLSNASSQGAIPVIINLHNAVAADVAQILQNYLGNGTSHGGSQSGTSDFGVPVNITIDSLSNSLILYSAIPDKLEEVKKLIAQLDKNNALTSNLHVVYLKNADAAHIAEVLRVVANNQENPDIKASSALAHFSTEPTSTFNAGSSGSSSGSGSGLSGNNSSLAQQMSGGRNSNQNNKEDQPKVIIQAEATTNSLIIQAPAAIYKNLRMIIDMLDIRRAQVMIEAMIADINQSTQGVAGIQWLAGVGNNQVGGIGLTNYGGSYNGTSNSLVDLGTGIYGAKQGLATGSGSSSGLAIPKEVYIGLVTGTTTVGGQQIPSISALADVIASNSIGNIISRPTLITLDNEEARILVGENIGVPSGQYQNTAANPGSLATTFNRQDLGTVLQIKPLITQSGTIQLDIWQEDSALDSNIQVNSQDGPAFLKRNIRATVLVDDGQIIALGGMTRDTVTINKNGIPLLSSIPYIGWLFSWQSRSHEKQNLILFLRPVIVKNADGLRALSNARYNYIINQENLAQAEGNWLLPTIKPVTLSNQVPYAAQIENTNTKSKGNVLNNNINLPIVDLTKQKSSNVNKNDDE